MKRPRIITIIPAHNEEHAIGATLQTVINQPFPATRIIVALDNCTDRTIDEVKKFPSVKYFKTKNNTGKKAGALNQAVIYMLKKFVAPDYILQMDADTLLDERAIEAGVEELKNNPELAGVCNRFRVREYLGGSKLLYSLQALDFSFNDSNQVEKRLEANVLSGTATMLRWSALEEIRNSEATIWDESSSVEDYRLTLDLKKNGWKVRVGKKMSTRTDYMPTLKKLWAQRKRWSYGTIEELMVDGWQNHTKRDILTLLFSVTIMTFTIFFLSLLTVLLVTGQVDSWHWLGQVLVAVVIIDRAYRCKYIRDKTVEKLVLALTIIPVIIYSVFLTACYYYSAYLVFSGKPLTKW